MIDDFTVLNKMNEKGVILDEAPTASESCV